MRDTGPEKADMLVDTTISTTIRAATALLFAASFTQKLWHFAGFRVVLEQYLHGFGIYRPRLLGPLAAAVIALEVLIVAACFWPGGGVVAAILASATLLFYAFAMAVNIVRGNTLLDCGCTWGDARQRISAALVARNMLLSLAISIIALPTNERELLAMDVVSISLATLAATLLSIAVNNLLVLADPYQGHVR